MNHQCRTIALLTVGIMGLQVNCSAEYLQEVPADEVGPEPVRQIASYLLNKRNPPESAGSHCEIHKFTLAELYNIVKEESARFESCLIRSEHKRSQHSNAGCEVLRQTLLELFQIVKTE